MASRSMSTWTQEAKPLERFSSNNETERLSATAPIYSGLTDFIRLLRRRRRIIVSTIAVIMAITIIALIRITPIYEATTTVLVKPLLEQASVDQQGDTPITAPPNEAARIATRVRLLQSRSLARQVVKSAGLQDIEEFAPNSEKPGLIDSISNWFGAARSNQNEPKVSLNDKDAIEEAQQKLIENVTGKFLSNLSVDRVGDSNLVDISVKSEDPMLARMLANRVAQTYIKGVTEGQDDADEASHKWLTERVTALDRQLRETETAIAQYRASHGLIAEDPAGMQQSQLSQASIALAQARADRAAIDNQQNGRGSAVSASSALLESLRGQEATVARRLLELEVNYGSAHPEVVASVSQLSEIRRRISVETARVQTAERQEAAALTAAAMARESALSREVGLVSGSTIQARLSNVNLQSLEREAAATRTLYQSLLERLKRESERQSKDADISIVSRAWLPDSASFPQTKQILAVALISALAFAVILALAAEAVDDRIRNADQVQRLLNLPTLAMVPLLSQEMRKLPPAEMITHQPRSLFSEAMRNLVIELETRRTQPGSQVVVITSPVPDDGKSTISAALAAAAASLGRRAIVVDLDMRRPGNQADDDASAGADLIAFLGDHANLDELLVDGEHGFSTISIRQKVVDPRGLLESPRLRALIEELRNRFDLVALNAPPIIPVRDAKTLTSIADSAILVIRWGVTDPSAAATAVDIFGNELMGVVINGVDYTEHARRAYGDAIDHASRYGGGYYIQPEKIAKPWLRLGRQHS